MAHEHTVIPGDSMASLAKRYGFIWEQLWDHPNNKELADLRQNPNTLMSGDVVFIPDIEPKSVDVTMEQRFRYRRKGIPSKLTLQLKENGEPRADIPYTIELDDSTILDGRTDADGFVKASVQPERKWGIVRVDGRWGPEEYTVRLGHLDPIDEISGVQQRLSNLGADCPTTGEMDDKTKAALTNFQARHKLDKTGEIDDATRQKLLEECGS